jgi:hypothetical protein
VAYKTSFGLDDCIYCALYIHTVRNCRQYSAIAILHTFQFNVTQVLGFSAFISRILATGLSQSHCKFKPHVKSSCHSLIPSLPFLLSHLRLPSSELDPILFLLDYFTSRLLSSTPLYSASTTTPVLPNTSYNHFARTPWKTPSSIINNVYLLVPYLATDVLLLSRACVFWECVYRPVA